MTHVSLARKLKSDYTGLALLGLIAAAFAAVNIATSLIWPNSSVRSAYGDAAFGFRLGYGGEDPAGMVRIDGPWPFYCGLAITLLIVIFIYAIIGGAVFRSYLGSGMTRVSIWIIAVRDIVTLALAATAISAVVAGVCTILESNPPTTGDSLSVWASLPIAFVTYLAMGGAGFLISILFVAYHWIVGVGAIAFILFGLSALSRSIDPTPLFDVVGHETFTPPIIGLAWLFIAFLVLVISLPIASRIPMRR